MGFTVDKEHEARREARRGVPEAGAVRILLARDDGAKGLDRAKGEGFSLQITTAQDVDALARRIKDRGGVLASEPADALTARAPSGWWISTGSS